LISILFTIGPNVELKTPPQCPARSGYRQSGCSRTIVQPVSRWPERRMSAGSKGEKLDL